MPRIEDLPEFDAAKYLTDEESIVDYLTDLASDDNPALTQYALGVAVRAAGMMEICERTGLTRQGINKATKIDSRPSFETLNIIAKAFGLRFKMERIAEAA